MTHDKHFGISLNSLPPAKVENDKIIGLVYCQDSATETGTSGCG